MKSSDLNQKSELTKISNQFTSLLNQYSSDWTDELAQLRKRQVLMEKLVEGTMEKWLEVKRNRSME